MEWKNISGLSDSANTLMAEEWALLDWLGGHADHPDRDGVLDALIANGKRFDALGERKYK